MEGRKKGRKESVQWHRYVVTGQWCSWSTFRCSVLCCCVSFLGAPASMWPEKALRLAHCDKISSRLGSHTMTKGQTTRTEFKYSQLKNRKRPFF